MAVTDQQLEEAKVRFVTNSNSLEAIVQGSDTEDVDIGNGKSLQTVAKLYKQIIGDYSDVELLINRDKANGYPSLTNFKLNLLNSAGTIKSTLTSAATAVRSWTMPDKDGTLAMMSDVTATSTGVNTGDETTATILSKLNITGSFGNGVLTTVLTALGAGTNAAIVATDTVLQAFAKLQAQLKAVPYDFMGYIPGKPAVSSRVLFVQTGRAFTIPANFAGARVKAMTAATAATVWTITKNGTSVGTFSWAAGAAVPTLATTGASAVSFVASDELVITAGSTQDTTLADISFHILANIT